MAKIKIVIYDDQGYVLSEHWLQAPDEPVPPVPGRKPGNIMLAQKVYDILSMKIEMSDTPDFDDPEH